MISFLIKDFFMIDFYIVVILNGYKIVIVLEEMGLEYIIYVFNFLNND